MFSSVEYDCGNYIPTYIAETLGPRNITATHGSIVQNVCGSGHVQLLIQQSHLMIVCQFAQLCLFLASLDRCKNITRIVKRPQKVERQLVDCRSAPFHKKTTSKFQKSDCYSFVMRQGCFFSSWPPLC